MDEQYTFTQQEIDDGKGLAGLAYITWIGLLIAFLVGKENRFTRYHIQQALVLLIAFLLVPIPVIGWIWGIFCLVLWVMGLINGFSGNAKPLFLIGPIGFKFNILEPDDTRSAQQSQTQPTPPAPPQTGTRQEPPPPPPPPSTEEQQAPPDTQG